MAARVATGSDTEIMAAGVDAIGLILTPCDGQEHQRTELAEELDLLAGAALVLPAGESCAVRLELDPPLELSGIGARDQEFTLLLELDSVTLDASDGFTVDGDDFVLELAAPGGLSDERLFDGGERDAGSAAREEDVRDDTGDAGSASDSGEPATGEQVDDGGCQSGEFQAGWLLLPLLWRGRRRLRAPALGARPTRDPASVPPAR